MKAWHPVIRGLLVVAGAAPAWLSTSAAAKHAPSAKKEESRACLAAFEKAQEREKAGHLREARDQWALCARPTCIPFFQEECTTRYTQLDADIPTVVPVCIDESGTERVDVEVRVDGDLLTARLDGRALPIDPGMHEFVFKTDGNVISEKLLIMQGQRNRPISVTLGSPPEPVAPAPAAPAAAKPAEQPTPAAPRPPPIAGGSELSQRKEVIASGAPRLRRAEPIAGGSEPSEGSELESPSPLTYALGAGGLVAVGAGALMIYWGRKDNDLLGQCSPMCPPNQVDHIRNVYRAADISLGIGVAALAGSYLVYALTRPTESKAPAARDEALRFDLRPAGTGAVASVAGRF